MTNDGVLTGCRHCETNSRIDKSSRAVPDQDRGSVRGKIGPLFRQVLGTAINALIVGIAEFPDLEAGGVQDRNQVMPKTARLVQSMHEDHARSSGRVLPDPQFQPVPAVVARGHRLREPHHGVAHGRRHSVAALLAGALRPTRSRGRSRRRQSERRAEEDDTSEIFAWCDKP